MNKSKIPSATSIAPVRRVVVAGANSPTGRLLLLLLRDADVHVTALVREPVRLTADETVAHWTHSERSFEVIAEADAVVLLTGTSGSCSEDWKAYQQGMVDTAERIAAAVGTRHTRVVYFSHVDADAEADNWHLKAKGLAERMLARLHNSVIFRIGPVVRGSPHPLPFELSLQQRVPGETVLLAGDGEQRCRPINLGDVATIAEAAALGEGDAGVYELGGPEDYSLAELAQLVNGRQVPLRCVSVEQFSAQRGVSATMVGLMTRNCAPHATENTAARFGVQLTPLSLAWPLDDPDSFDEDTAIAPAAIFSFAQNP